MFLLLGPTNYQCHPAGVKRIGYVNITVVPNNENRALNIFYKYAGCLIDGLLLRSCDVLWSKRIQ